MWGEGEEVMEVEGRESKNMQDRWRGLILFWGITGKEKKLEKKLNCERKGREAFPQLLMGYEKKRKKDKEQVIIHEVADIFLLKSFRNDLESNRRESNKRCVSLRACLFRWFLEVLYNNPRFTARA